MLKFYVTVQNQIFEKKFNDVKDVHYHVCRIEIKTEKIHIYNCVFKNRHLCIHEKY